VGDTSMSSTLVEDGVRSPRSSTCCRRWPAWASTTAYVDLSAAEVPIMDGSAGPFVFLMQSAGIEEQNAAKKFIRIKKPVTVEDGDKWARFEPFEGFKVGFTIDFKHPIFSKATPPAPRSTSRPLLRQGSQPRPHLRLHEGHRDAARAQPGARRLDGQRHRARRLPRAQRGRLRYEDEFVKHKILDAIGDLYLLGHSLIGAFYGYKSGHGLNNQLLRHAGRRLAWEEVTFDDQAKAPISYAHPAQAPLSR
jgi:UDP-3-O-[3-hydroxymyristoyl] N-acetylglucosamine deacetylase